jgi:predicted lipoprotein
MRPKLEYLRFLAHDLFELTSGNLAIVLDLSLGFNALDGD